ncbi:hypothetical protein COU37_03840 [Candidatus Micrarchaeota archaeon CG10_big_fil_rev_8_21_14_0_10_45_29]|nr:MAG: hypothetical protein COU37_03840 [Candidatus Micrarchaeota archaeon CG10_big_fil_rev_8_21_14_0_10_45_29]
MKPVRVILSDEAEEAYNELNARAANSKIECSILKFIDYKKNLIKANPHYGEPVAKKLIPAVYIKKYEIKNLFWVSLANRWRMFYTLKNDGEIEIIAFVLCIKSHPDYDWLMGYKKDRKRK